MDQQAIRFINQVAGFFEQEGYARIAGLIFGRLLLAAGPVTLHDLVLDLAVSKASISTDARRLERRGLIERVRRPGDRRAYYRIAEGLPERIMTLRLDRVQRFEALLRASRPRLEAADPVVANRLADLQRAHGHMVSAMTSMLRAWRDSSPDQDLRDQK